MRTRPGPATMLSIVVNSSQSADMTLQQRHHVVIVLGRNRCPCREPRIDVGIAVVQQGFVAVKLCIVEGGDVPVGEAAEQEIGLARAAMPTAEPQPFLADLEGFAHCRCFVSQP